MTTFFIVLGLMAFVAGVLALCNCRDKDESYKTNGLVIIGPALCIFSVGCFFIASWQFTIGYSAINRNLNQNAVYEVVSSSQVDNQSIAILREPDGHLRFFAFAAKDGVIESGQFLKAIGDEGRTRRLMPLTNKTFQVQTTPVSSVESSVKASP